MAEYIEREALLKRLEVTPILGCGIPYQVRDGVLDLVSKQPAADVVLVRHGEWQGTADGYADGELVYDMWNCSKCGFDADGAEERPDWKFCPNCGARMDLGGAD